MRKPGEGDMGDIGQPSKMFTLSMCTTVNRKTWGKPYTRVRWVSKFNFLEWYMDEFKGFVFLDTTHF